MLKQIKWYDWLIITGILIIMLVNPLSASYMITAMNILMEVIASMLSVTLSVAGTLIVVGFIAGKVVNRERKAKKFKSLSKRPTQKAGDYITT